MKFYGPPNMLLRVRNMKPIRAIRFDLNGEYETENPRLIARLKTRFPCEKAKEETKKEPKEEKKLPADGFYNCKKCDFKTENQGDLLVHYRTNHPKKPKK
jgi:hypothetical protein